MDTDQIECLLRKTYHHEAITADFLGVFPSDQLPLPFSRWPAAFVANTDPSDRPGQHWVAVYQESPSRPLEFFDSCGLSPEFFSLTLPISPLILNNKQLQGFDSNVCGHYCIFFLVHRPLARSFRDTLNLISALGASTKDRDQTVQSLIRMHMFYPRVSCDSSHSHSQCCVPRNLFNKVINS